MYPVQVAVLVHTALGVCFLFSSLRHTDERQKLEKKNSGLYSSALPRLVYTWYHDGLQRTMQGEDKCGFYVLTCALQCFEATFVYGMYHVTMPPLNLIMTFVLYSCIIQV